MNGYRAFAFIWAASAGVALSYLLLSAEEGDRLASNIGGVWFAVAVLLTIHNYREGERR